MDDLRKIKDFYCSWAQGTALYARWANNQGIGYPEFMVLYALNISDKLTQKQLVKDMDCQNKLLIQLSEI